MRWAAFTIAAAIATAAFAQSSETPLALGFHVSRDPISVSRVRVYDGDTFDVGNERFRIESIDTPELRRAHCPLERRRAEDAKIAAQAIFNNAERIIITPARGRRDRYARVVASISVDGRDFGERMIEEGHARPYRRPPGWNWCATPVAICVENSEACGRGSPANAGND